MKIYTQEQVIEVFEKYGNMSAINARNILDLSESIELPSDEEIKTYLNNHSYDFEHGFKNAIEFIKNKIQGQ